MKYFIANWKARKTLSQANQWLEVFLAKVKSNQKLLQDLQNNIIKIIICPPIPFIFPLREKFGKEFNLSFGSQDVSRYDEGSYTGEITSKALFGLIDYVILGHSERRIYLDETNETILKKIELAKKYSIEPVLCVRNKEDVATRSLHFITYEPVHSIGTGLNESLEDILKVKKELNLTSDNSFFYGGSVNQNNINSYRESDEIKGFLVGTASLDPLDFYRTLAVRQ